MNGKMNFMIDIETTGTVPDKHYVTSVGIVQFELTEEGAVPIDEFEFRLETDRVSRLCDAKTMKWRKSSGVDEAEESIEQVFHWRNLTAALATLNNWIADRTRGARGITMWAHHCQFDFGFLDSLYREAGLEPVWGFWAVRDSDTFVETAARAAYKTVNKQVEFGGKAHKALDDARHQVLVMDKARELEQARAELLLVPLRDRIVGLEEALQTKPEKGDEPAVGAN